MAEANNASDHSLLWGYALEFWDRVGIISLVVGAIVGVFALLLTAASAYILYRVADAAQIELVAETKRGSERLAELTVQAEQLRKETAESQERTKKAETRLVQLRKLAERRALIDKEGFLDRLKDAPKCRVEILYLRDAPDARWLGEMISSAFVSAGWGIVPVEPIPDLDPSSDAYRRGDSNVMAVGGQASGVTVASRLTTHDSAQAIIRALSRGMQSVMMGSMGDVPVPEGTVRVVIGRKIEPIFVDTEEYAAPDIPKE